MKSTLVLVVLLLLCERASAQVINLYSRMTDPRGIARLAVLDSSPTKSINFHGDARWNLDSVDHIPNVARDTGSGVITHLWSACGDPDSTVTIWLYIDDTLVLSGKFDQFFGMLHGLFRPPLDTMAHGAGICDVQIPYHHGFRLAMISTGGNVYWAVEWHWVPESVLPWFSVSKPIPPSQQNAEFDFLDASCAWTDSNSVTLFANNLLSPQSATTVADISGPAMLRQLHFIPATYDRNVLDSTWLNIYWDKNPEPSVHVPLLDFFLCPVTVNNVRALDIHSGEDSGFLCYFPMPFFLRARVELVRTASTPLSIFSTVQYHPEPIDRNTYGYFHADFKESNPTRYHVWHPVVHTVGRGRFVGFGWGVMEHPFAVFLEGNPRFQIDSNVDNFIEFTGAEDYFDAAWWFSQGMFSVSFAGFTDFIDAFYRFQYMDAYEFTKSFDFDMQPGNAEDVYDHFRTVGYYYLHWTPFWTDRDTLVPGETWRVSGAGYVPEQRLKVALGSQEFAVNSNEFGDFSASIQVNSSWVPGAYSLSVNGEVSPKTYLVLATPAIRPLVDTLPITLRAGDSLWVSGTGFRPGEKVSLYFDSIPLHQSVVADSNYGFVLKLRVPYVAEHSYYLIARGDISGNATSQDFVTVTRTVNLEFEDMMPPTFQTQATCYAEDVSYFWEALWSKQMFVYFKPDSGFTANAALELQFMISHPDTFAFEFHASVSPDQGRYSIWNDGDSIGTVDGYAITGGWNPLPLPSGPIPLGTHYLDTGSHKVRFVCLGKDDSATNYWIQPDNIILKPTTYLAPTPGTILAGVALPPSSIVPERGSILVFPNPDRNAPITVQVILGNGDSVFFNGWAYLSICDVLGREITSFSGPLVGNLYSGTASFQNHDLGTYFVRIHLVSRSGNMQDFPLQKFSVQ